jgi:hypothetical protein
MMLRFSWFLLGFLAVLLDLILDLLLYDKSLEVLQYFSLPFFYLVIVSISHQRIFDSFIIKFLVQFQYRFYLWQYVPIGHLSGLLGCQHDLALRQFEFFFELISFFFPQEFVFIG